MSGEEEARSWLHADGGQRHGGEHHTAHVHSEQSESAKGLESQEVGMYWIDGMDSLDMVNRGQESTISESVWRSSSLASRAK